MNNSEPLRLKELSPLPGKPFCDRLGGSLFGVEMDTKVCSNCGIKKSVTEFSKDQRSKDGLQYHCKACRADYRSSHKAEITAYYQANREKIIARVHEYNRTHVEEIAAFKREYNRAYKLRYPMRYRARSAISNAIYRGKLIRPDHCENPECNIKCKPEAHHHKGYEPEFWLDVIFLCTECHKIADRKLKEELTNDNQ